MTRWEELHALADRVAREAPSKALDRAVEIALRGMLAQTDQPPRRDKAEAIAALRKRAAEAGAP